MKTAMLLPPPPPFANRETIERAYACAWQAYMRCFFESANTAFKPPAGGIVTVESIGMKSNAARKHLLEHGFVKIGRTRAKDGKRFTTIYVRTELVGNYASPTDAYKDFLKCEKN